MKNISGHKYGKLTIVSFSHREANRYYWLCKCDCGKEKIIQAANFKSGTTKSCGCGMIECRTKHGLAHTRIWNIYQAMMARCYNSSYPDFQNWGGRGITVCEEWKEDKQTFFKWALANGYANDLQIDRKENDLNYTPDNCRFVTRKVNCRNRRSNVIVFYKGESKTLVEWCELLSLPYRLTRQRITNFNWEPKQAFFAPLFSKKNKTLAK